MMVSDERRINDRHPATVAVSVSTDSRRNRLAITRNLSAGGVLFHSRSRFPVGERLKLVLSAVDKAVVETIVRGTAVRSEHLSGDTLFPHLTAVRFDSEVPEYVDAVCGYLAAC